MHINVQKFEHDGNTERERRALRVDRCPFSRPSSPFLPVCLRATAAHLTMPISTRRLPVCDRLVSHAISAMRLSFGTCLQTTQWLHDGHRGPRMAQGGMAPMGRMAPGGHMYLPLSWRNTTVQTVCGLCRLCRTLQSRASHRCSSQRQAEMKTFAGWQHQRLPPSHPPTQPA